MKVFVAEYAGYCYGVKRAVGLALAQVGKDRSAATLGPLIHNPQFIEELREKGIGCKNELSEFKKGEKIILRSHGVGPEIYKEIAKQDLELVDATCPNVKMAQQKAWQAVEDGYLPVIIGEKEHPEVKSIKNWTQNEGFVVEYKGDIGKLPFADKYAVIVQTTFEQERYEQLLSELQRKRPGSYRVENTICHATHERQTAALELAGQVDAMVVIGGHNSANTRHLADIVKKKCNLVLHIETIRELDRDFFKGCNKIGITAGASTPDRLIKEAVVFMENMENMESFEELLEKEKGVKVYPGAVLDTEVIQKDKDGVYVAFGYMKEGFIPYNEWSTTQSAEELFNTIEIGTKTEAKVVLSSGKEDFIRMSKVRADREASWKNVAPLAEGETRLATVKVLRVIRNNKTKNIVGLSVFVEDVEGFMPASHVELRRVEDFDQYVGKELQAEIIEVNLEERRLVVSRRNLLRQEKEERREQREARIAAAREARAAAAEAAMETIEEGTFVTGKVVKVAEFGLFVEIAKGLVGLVHSTELSWERGVKPADVAQEGDEVQVMIKRIDKEAKRVGLSIKATLDDPWKIAADEFPIGQVFTGKVVKFLAFGAIVKLSDKIEGLVHVSEVSNERVAKAEDVLEVGQEVKVMVLKVDYAAKKMGLSIAKATQAADEAGYENYMGKSKGLTTDLSDKFEK
ncbi:MAG: 4-hydroxy-3-methylbut-2-enyl diphosphate reductase [Acidaminococcaceae bacterium]|nr:4-hydroxy-3-methylbut-2-enyl diphosphate reductase [Acidaminococcaceae bacterium]